MKAGHKISLPPYFAAFDWQKTEEEADTDITGGRVKSFSTVDDFLADLTNEKTIACQLF